MPLENLLDLALPWLPLPDFTLPNLYWACGAPVGAILILSVVVILLEAWALRRTITTGHSVKDAFWMNLVSSLLGLVPVLAFLSLHYPPDMSIVVWLPIGWLVSVVSEGLVLKRRQPHNPTKKIILATLVANTLSYLLIAMLVYLTPWKAYNALLWDRSIEDCHITVDVITWQDLNRNGLEEDGEPRLPFVQYRRVDIPGANFQLTSQNGSAVCWFARPCYSLDKTVEVEVIAPPGCTLTTGKSRKGAAYRFGFACGADFAPEGQLATEVAYRCQDATYSWAATYYYTGEYQKALQVMSCMLELDPDAALASPEFISLRVNIYLGLDDLPAAIADLKNLLAIMPGDVVVMSQICRYSALSGQVHVGLPYCEQAVQESQKSSNQNHWFTLAPDNRGLAYALLGRFEEASADFQAYIDEYADTSNPVLVRQRKLREGWVATLRQGRNPFTHELLAELGGGSWAAQVELPASPFGSLPHFCDTVVEIPFDECAALVDLYTATGGESWNTNSEDWLGKDLWLATNTPCSWGGLTCANGHVSELSLGQVGLQGAIPAGIGNLDELTRLDLTHNQLTSLPAEMGSLWKLSELGLSDNQLDSLLDVLGSLGELSWLDLSGNQLASLPDLSHLTKLDYLVLSNNQLSGLPDGLGSLTGLVGLYAANNNLTSLPPEIGNLTSLKTLWLAGNLLESLPPEITRLSNLVALDVASNQISGLPPGFGALVNLQHLYLQGNHLSSLPPEIGNLSLLHGLDLSENELSSLPVEIGKLTGLTLLDLSDNRLTSVPAEIGSLTGLVYLHLGGNQLTGLPLELCSLSNLNELSLANNPLSSLPDELCAVFAQVAFPQGLCAP